MAGGFISCPLIITNWKKEQSFSFLLRTQWTLYLLSNTCLINIVVLNHQLKALSAWSSHYSQVKTEPVENDCLVCHIQILYNPWVPVSLTLPDKVTSSSVECVWLLSPKRWPIFSTICQKQLFDWLEQRPVGYDEVRFIQEMWEKEECGKGMGIDYLWVFLEAPASLTHSFPSRGPMCVVASSGIVHDGNTKESENETHSSASEEDFWNLAHWQSLIVFAQMLFAQEPSGTV